MIVASVSCLYGLGMPQDYADARLTLRAGDAAPGSARGLADRLRSVLYKDPLPPFDEPRKVKRGELFVEESLSSLGAASVVFWPPQEPSPVRLRVDARGVLCRIEFAPEAAAEAEGDTAAGPVPVAEPPDPSARSGGGLEELIVYPARHYVTSKERLQIACGSIRVRPQPPAHPLTRPAATLSALTPRRRTLAPTPASGGAEGPLGGAPPRRERGGGVPPRAADALGPEGH